MSDAHKQPSNDGDAHGAHHDEAHKDGAAHDGGHAADAAHDAHAAHGGHAKHKAHEHDHPPGTPTWLISFGDMMTLFLCFFIILVTMADTQDSGMMARGVGNFVSVLHSSGPGSVLGGDEQLMAVNNYRERFGLEPITEEDLLVGRARDMTASDVEKLVKESLKPLGEVSQPMLAAFEPGSKELSSVARRYLDMIAESLRPGLRQMLILEGHAPIDAARAEDDPALLAFARAKAVRDYLLERHGFVPSRVEARVWAVEIRGMGSNDDCVDARFVQPMGES